jgi:hypothetical protein
MLDLLMAINMYTTQSCRPVPIEPVLVDGYGSRWSFRGREKNAFAECSPIIGCVGRIFYVYGQPEARRFGRGVQYLMDAMRGQVYGLTGGQCDALAGDFH